MSLDIEDVVYESYESHTEESEKEDIRLLPIEERIFDESVVLQDKGEPYHKQHDDEENTASHSRGSLLMFVELGENRRFLSGHGCLADILAELIFPKDLDIDGIDDPRDEEGDQCEHDDIVQFD